MQVLTNLKLNTWTRLTKLKFVLKDLRRIGEKLLADEVDFLQV
jgi:hypothetical protein